MNFQAALAEMKAGFAVARSGWNGKNMFIVMMPGITLAAHSSQDPMIPKVDNRLARWVGEDMEVECNPYLAMYTADKKWQPGWLASQTDMLADDWNTVTPTVRNRVTEQELETLIAGQSQ